MVGESGASSVWSLLETGGEAAIGERKRLQRRSGRHDASLVSGDQNKELIKDKRAARW